MEIESVEKIKNASDEELLEVKGINGEIVKELRSNLNN